ncbi:MAG: TAT-variant-translocated molybdopterin oxidoreductase, partial [Pseudomonadota bacterium]
MKRQSSSDENANGSGGASRHEQESAGAAGVHPVPAGPRARVSLPVVDEALVETELRSSEVRRYWRSIAEKEGSPSLASAARREFPPGASELPEPNRRSFMQLLGSGAALAGVAACQQPQAQTVPFVRRPGGVTPGIPLHFATGYSLEGYSNGLLVESYEGRPTKIEGNPDHRDSLGAAGTFDQALLLGLYDDNRAKQIRHRNEPMAWISLLGRIAQLAGKHAADGGARLRFLTEPTASPLLIELRQRILTKFPSAKFTSYSPVAGDGAADGLRLSYGRDVQARHDLTRAAVIVSLDADFLGAGPEQLRLSRQFAARRVPGPEMNRLYVVEPSLSVTGMSADHRLRSRAGDVAAFAFALAAELAGRSGFGQLSALGAGRTQAPVDAKWVRAVADDLVKHRGRSLIIAGRRQPAALHAAVAALNAALDNVGNTVSYAAPLLADASGGARPLATLAQEIAAGQVDTLVITARNPVYAAPADLRFDKLLERVPTTIYHGLYEDETAPVATFFVPAAHPLESWGDGRATDGTLTITQPLIAPLWDGHTDTELLAAFLGEGDVGAHALLRRSWQAKAASLPGTTGVEFDLIWEKWLSDGLVVGTETAPLTDLTLDVAAITKESGLWAATAGKGAGTEIVFAPDYKVFDGRFANASWLQELPDPITKVTWDNAALMSPAMAKALGVEVERDSDKFSILAIDYRDRHIQAPALIVPGHADDCITLTLGYGRGGAEQVAHGVGYNAGALRTSEAPWFDRGAQVSLATGMHLFAITQNHWSAEGREPAMDTTLAEFDNPKSEFHERVEERRGVPITIHRPVDYSNQQYKWGMSIDLSRCTGCSACVVACQSENNIPVVGKANVVVGREMQWLRIDRYYSGELEDPEVVVQPLGCVHCETAPCEYVCPVNATVHSDEGLNEMVYNRCIGTRYCSN